MIQLNDLQFYYDDQQILYDISLHLDKNTITGLIGPNGAGKSTLMRCIAGLEIPQAGTVKLDGQPILDDPKKSYLKIGYLPDIFSLSDNLTVLQSLTYAGSARGLTTTQLSQAIWDTAQLLGLERKLYDLVGNLSRGQKQRVGIGQVIIHRPQLLILDEPASGLDPEARYELSILFNTLKTQGITLLISSHILSELDEYCTHMLVIKDGRIKQHSALQQQNVTAHLIDENAQLPIVLRFLSPLDATQQILIQNAPHIHQLHFNQTQVTASIPVDEKYRAILIQYLVQHQLPLIGLEPLKESLLQNYRNSLKEGVV